MTQHQEKVPTPPSPTLTHPTLTHSTNNPPVVASLGSNVLIPSKLNPNEVSSISIQSYKRTSNKQIVSPDLKCIHPSELLLTTQKDATIYATFKIKARLPNLFVSISKRLQSVNPLTSTSPYIDFSFEC